MSEPLRLTPAPSQFDKLPPHDVEAEQALVGSLYLAARERPDIMAEILVRASADDFYLPEHRLIAKAIIDMREAGRPVDEITLPAELKRRDQFEEIGGRAGLADCVNMVPSVAGGAHYAKIVHEHAQLRRIIQELGDVVYRAYEPAYDGEDLSNALIQATQQTVDALTAKASEQSLSFAEAVEQTILELENGGVACLETGFRDIDEAFGGLGYGETIVAAARPSMGKSLFTRQLAVHAAMKGHPVGIFALEESHQKIVRNALSWFTGIQNNRLRLGRDRGHFRDDEWARIRATAEELKTLPIYVSKDTWGLDQICALATAWKARHDIEMLITDHIGLVRTPGKSPYERASLTSVTLKQLHKKLNVVGVEVAQINRANTDREDTRPKLSDLRDSGRIEEDADGVVLLHREDYYHRNDPNYTPTSIVDVIFAKWRDGDTAQRIQLRSRLSTQHFEDLLTREPEVLPYGL